jgi:two-component system, NtrC family, sensor histidine kinase HydH
VENAPAIDHDTLAAEVARLRPLAEMGRMAATVAHEIRNPLAGISANAELLRESLADPADVESADIILAEVDRLGRLVSDLLFYCRERPAERKAMDLAWLARTTVDLSTAEAQRAGVDLTWSGTGRADGDQELSRQALLNVIRNAVQACEVGGRVIVAVADGVIRVADTGGGVPEAIVARLFEPFVTGRTRGLGLGSTVAKRCQVRQEGDLRLERTGSTGSVFALTWG